MPILLVTGKKKNLPVNLALGLFLEVFVFIFLYVLILFKNFMVILEQCWQFFHHVVKGQVRVKQYEVSASKMRRRPESMATCVCE